MIALGRKAVAAISWWRGNRESRVDDGDEGPDRCRRDFKNGYP